MTEERETGNSESLTDFYPRPSPAVRIVSPIQLIQPSDRPIYLPIPTDRLPAPDCLPQQLKLTGTHLTPTAKRYVPSILYPGTGSIFNFNLDPIRPSSPEFAFYTALSPVSGLHRIHRIHHRNASLGTSLPAPQPAVVALHSTSLASAPPTSQKKPPSRSPVPNLPPASRVPWEVDWSFLISRSILVHSAATGTARQPPLPLPPPPVPMPNTHHPNW